MRPCSCYRGPGDHRRSCHLCEIIVVRTILLGLFLTAVAQPCFAQKFLSFEPLMMDPYATVFVDNGSCSAGKVLKVQGAPNNQRRKKSCVPISDVRGPGAVRGK